MRQKCCQFWRIYLVSLNHQLSGTVFMVGCPAPAGSVRVGPAWGHRLPGAAPESDWIFLGWILVFLEDLCNRPRYSLVGMRCHAH